MGMRIRSKLRHEEEGAAAVEFALIVGLLAVLIFGLLEYGLAFWQVQNLRSATREGARVAAVGGNDTAVRSQMVASSAGSLSGAWTYTQNRTCDGSDANKGQQVTVRLVNGSLPGSVQEAFQVSIPFLPPIQLNPVLEGSFRCEQ
jgi:Flp pilus assembly protein TadG